MKRTRIGSFILGLACLSGLGASGEESDGPIKVGAEAPDFELEGSDGKKYKLSDFKGKQGVVVAWYPKAFTGG